MSSNIQRLGATLADRMKKTSAAAIPMLPVLGTIGSNLSLNVDSLPDPIPKGDYMMNLMLAGDSYRTGSAATADGLSHSHTLPDTFRSLKAGDRVLVVWCGNEPVIVAVVVSS